MKRISEKTKSVLLAAVEKTAELVNAGDTPNAAIVKAAQACDVPCGNIHLVVHAYNTGRTNKQRQLGQTPQEKAAEFDLADTDEVLALLYPTTEKLASARVAQDTTVDPAYSYSPRDMLRRREHAEKMAGVIAPPLVEKPPEPLPRDPVEAMNKAYAKRAMLLREIETLRRDKTAAEQRMAVALDALGDYFHRPGCISLATVQNKCASLHGPIANQIFTMLKTADPGLEKLACANRVLQENVPAVGGPFELVNRIMTAAEDYIEASDTFLKQSAVKQQQAEVLLLPFVPSPMGDPSVLTPSSTTKAAGLGAAIGAAGVVSAMGRGLDSAQRIIVGPDTKDLLRSDYDALTDPHHEARLRNIRTQAILHDLINNDDVIGGYDPQETLHAFNDISQVAPRVVDHRLLIQSLLRKRLAQGSFDPFEGDQMLGLEQKLQRRDTPMTGQGGGDGSVL